MVSHLVERAAAAGAKVMTGEPGRVTGFGTAAGRRGAAVRTAAGQEIWRTRWCAAQARWVPQLAALAGAACPVPLVPWAEPGAAAPGLVVQAGPGGLPGPGPDGARAPVHLRPQAGGLVHLEAPDAAVDLHTPERGSAALGQGAAEPGPPGVVRGLDDAAVTGYRVCVRPMPVDGRSIVGWLPGAGGVYVAVTHSGVTLGAHLAELIAAEVLGDGAEPELAPFRPDRFLAE